MTNPYEPLRFTVRASGDDGAGHVAENVLDNDIGGSSRWSGRGGWIEADLGDLYKVHNVDVAWYRGDQRKTRFKILVSNDGLIYRYVTWRSSSGKTLDPEKYDFPDEICRYVRLEFMGSTDNADGSENEWFSITHLDIEGINTPILPQPVLTTLEYGIQGGIIDAAGNVKGTTEDEFTIVATAVSDQNRVMPSQNVILVVNNEEITRKTTNVDGQAVFSHKFSIPGRYAVYVADSL